MKPWRILPEVYALVREASYRVLGKRHYDVQLIAATALFEEKLLNKNGEEKLFLPFQHFTFVPNGRRSSFGNC